MGVMVQIRNVPEPIHRKLKARAAAAGMSLSEYLLAEVSARAAEPTPEEMRARLARRRPVAPRESSAAAVRAERAAR
jgi:plasmid stability protein